MIAIKHILAPTDFSEPAERAVTYAIELARMFEARITLLHVWSLPSAGYAEGLTWPIEEMEAAAQSELERARVAVAERLPAADALLRRGLEWKEILGTAEARHADLIVMGTHGRQGLPRLVLGSVAEKVVRLAHVPVLTVGTHARPIEEASSTR